MECSAAGLESFLERETLHLGQSDLPEPTVGTRRVLIDAALDCDFELIASLAWTEVPPSEHSWGTFWGETRLDAAALRRLDETQYALWDLAVALIHTVHYWDFTECESGGSEWACGRAWYEWPGTRNWVLPSYMPDEELSRAALLDGRPDSEFLGRLLDGYSPFRVVIASTGEWLAAYPPTPGQCEAESGNPTYLIDEPSWPRVFSWTDTLGCLVRVDILYERTGPEHCEWEDTRILVTGEPFGARYHDMSDAIEYVRDPQGAYGVQGFVDGFVASDSLPADAVDTGIRLRDRELWQSPTDPDAIYIRNATSVERWPRGQVPGCA